MISNQLERSHSSLTGSQPMQFTHYKLTVDRLWIDWLFIDWLWIDWLFIDWLWIDWLFIDWLWIDWLFIDWS